MSVALTTLYGLIQPECMVTNFVLIDRAIIKTARTLCEKSRIWKDSEIIAPMVSGVVEMSVDSPVSNVEVVSIDYLTYNGLNLYSVTEMELNEMVPHWRDDVGIPTRFVADDLNNMIIRLYPKPNATDGDAFEYEVRLKPSHDATTLPDFLIDQFRDTIVAGALADLMSMSGMEWANAGRAMEKKTEFNHGVALATHKSMVGIASAPGMNVATLA